MKAYYVTFIRPVGSLCWTAERVAPTAGAADRQATEERNRKLRFHDGSLNLQSTATVCILLPDGPDATQQNYEPEGIGAVKRGIA